MVMQNGPWWNPNADFSNLPSPSIPAWAKKAPGNVLKFLSSANRSMIDNPTLAMRLLSGGYLRGQGGGVPSDLTPEVFDAKEALNLLRELKVVPAANDEWVQKNVPPADMIAEANARLANPDTETEARKALLKVRKSPPTPEKFTPKAPPTAPPFKYATLGGSTSAVAPGDFMGALNQSSMPPAAGGPMDVQSEIDSLTSLYNNMVSQPGFDTNELAQRQAQELLGRIFDLRDAQRKTSSAGGISADTAASIAQQQAALAEQKRQFDLQMEFERQKQEFERQQAIQRIREAQTATMERITALRQSATQQGNQFVAENARWASPAGSQYAPGREPGSLLAQAVQKAGYNFTPVERPTVAVDPYAASKQIETDVQELLQQMKGWGIGE